MTRLAIVVEGDTESEFVACVLADHLRKRGIEPTAVSLDGDVSRTRLVRYMANLSHSHNSVTSLVDFYGFRHKDAETPDELERLIDVEIRKKIGGSSAHSRLFTYIQKCEFEGLLFSDVRAFVDLPQASQETVLKLQKIRSQFPTPEEINDNRNTAPSKRITRIVPGYEKAVHGPLLAMKIGLETMRVECPRFGEWVTRLESLGRPN